jgi:hypothetical protein
LFQSIAIGSVPGKVELHWDILAEKRDCTEKFWHSLSRDHSARPADRKHIVCRLAAGREDIQVDPVVYAHHISGVRMTKQFAQEKVRHRHLDVDCPDACRSADRPNKLLPSRQPFLDESSMLDRDHPFPIAAGSQG